MRKEPPPADAITPATPRTNDSRSKRGAVGHGPVLCAWLSLWKFWTCWTVSVPGPAHAAAVPGVNVVVHLLVASWPLPSSHPKYHAIVTLWVPPGAFASTKLSCALKGCSG